MREKVLADLQAARERHDAELRALVTRAAADGISSQSIAEALGISRATLWRRYRPQLSHGNPGQVRRG